MKQLLSLFLFLLPCLAWAQYPSNGNQKITLGEQTTADGLIFRGVLGDTLLITPSSDTSAYIILDTVNNKFYNYKRNTNVWTLAGGGDGVTSVAALTLGTSGTDLSSTVANSTTTPVITLNVPNASATARGVVSIGTQIFKGLKTFTDSLEVRNITISNGNQSNNSNLAIGFQALNANTPTGGNNGTANTAIGFEAMKSNTTGFMNVGLGYRALTSNTSATFNMAVGMDAMYSNTSGSQNVALGRLSLYSNTTSSNNVAIGYASLNGSTGLGNTAVGSLSLYENTTGIQNTAIGFYAGWNGGVNANITGQNNTFIGNGAVNTASDVNHTITFGNSSIATIRAQVTSITGFSDIRDKTNIMPLNYGIDFIKKLNPVSFDWDMRDGGKIGISEIGFIAQELQQAQIDSQINIPNLVYDINPDKLEASYGVLIPIIVKALKEQQALIDELKQRILNLENK
jgi:hypothetical protein